MHRRLFFFYVWCTGVSSACNAPRAIVPYFAKNLTSACVPKHEASYNTFWWEDHNSTFKFVPSCGGP